ncbi:hemopexin-like [Parambassis ranga]|uniref:Hemopexin n=1 Tax=Parambassis ranga TaxID=210632 RepID=A0A6P7K9X3_9TELE|nr:hemopexin-like [Parambassis ranga]
MELFTKALLLCVALALSNAAPQPPPGAAGRGRTRGLCENHRDRVRGTSPDGVPMIGAYMPQCDEDGQYRPQQCHGSTGYCWCVNRRGQEKPGTKTPPGTPSVECPQHDQRLKTPCEHHQDSVQTTTADGLPLAGVYVPRCDADGQYEPQQCHPSTGYCWCVDRRGQKKQETETPPGTPSVECPKHTDERPKTRCENHRDGLGTRPPGAMPAVGAFVPQCDPEGQYTPKQCHGSTGFCWCVDSRGQEKAGTKTPPGSSVQCADHGIPDRCSGIEFDAITPDEKGNTFFFKGGHIWKGFRGPALHASDFFKDMDEEHNIGRVDAAFRMHNPENPNAHDHVFFFLDDKVFSYYNQTLEAGYPKPIQEVFPGVPSQLDAAVECPKEECRTDSVLFFKGQDVHIFDIPTKTVKTKNWPHLPRCTSAVRWLEHYYCFNGNNFTRFHPVSGEVTGAYPKDARNYFMRCANFGHGMGYRTPKCSEMKLDAITTDDAGKSYLFAGPIYMRLDTKRDGLHAFPITRLWKEVRGGVDAVFSYTDKTYIIQGNQVYIYKGGAQYTLVEGYPKTLKEELGIEGRVDAAFVCPNENLVHVIQGQKLIDVDLTTTPRTIARDVPLPLSDIDAALCKTEGIYLFKGGQFYKYESPMILAAGRIAPLSQKITSEMMGCLD